MHKTTLVALTSSLLLGAVAHAGQWLEGDADADRDGFLSRAEVKQAAPSLSPSFGSIDLDNDGKLSHEEFNTWHELVRSRMGADSKAMSSAAPDADASTDDNPPVGSARSNVDKKATSGNYYPYAAGTVGDDPARPKSTAAAPDATAKAGDDAAGSIDQWMPDGADLDGDGFLSHAELAKVSPTLSASFSAIDVDNDQKITRGEFRSWHESHKARLLAN